MNVNKKVFLETMELMLRGMSEDEKQDILYDYEEHFRIGLESGKSEQEISQSLGDPRVLARQYRAYTSVKAAEENTSANNIIRAVFAIGVLGLFNLIFVLGPFIGIVAIVFSFYAVAFACTLAGIIAAISTLAAPFISYIEVGINSFSAMCFSTSVFTIGVLFFILSKYLTKIFFKYTLRYLNWNIKFIK